MPFFTYRANRAICYCSTRRIYQIIPSGRNHFSVKIFDMSVGAHISKGFSRLRQNPDFAPPAPDRKSVPPASAGGKALSVEIGRFTGAGNDGEMLPPAHACGTDLKKRQKRPFLFHAVSVGLALTETNIAKWNQRKFWTWGLGLSETKQGRPEICRTALRCYRNENLSGDRFFLAAVGVESFGEVFCDHCGVTAFEVFSLEHFYELAVFEQTDRR